MTSTPDNTSSEPLDVPELKRLIAALSEGQIQAAEHDRLELLLRTHREARNVYMAYMQIDAGLDWKIRGRQSVRRLADLSPDCPFTTTVSQRSAASKSAARLRTHRRLIGWVAAASILLVSALIIGITTNNRPNVVVDAGSAARTTNGQRVVEPSESIAKVIELSDECRWFIENRRNGGDHVVVGDKVRLTRGQLRMEFNCGATVTMKSPAALEVVSPMRTRAVLGTLTAHVEKGAEGFTVETPRTTVVDLGTDFGIDVSEHGSTDVVVFTGAVDVHSDGVEGLESRQRLQAGEGVRVSGEGTASRIVSIDDSQFAITGGGNVRQRTPVIFAVSDNISRGESWYYYEVVHGGMREDARAFVDRPHEWNGVKGNGMPSYLLGADYVKTFNDDKVNQRVEIRVTLERPAILYVLLDKRSPPPTWLRETFYNTYDEVGLDGGGYKRFGVGPEKTVGVGAGESVDDTFSVWRLDVPKAGTVRLGAMGAGSQYHNMYAIAAVPLEIHESDDDFADSRDVQSNDLVALPADDTGKLSIDGQIEQANDVDVFKFDWQGGVVEVDCSTNGLTTLDPTLLVYDATGNLVGRAEVETGRRERTSVAMNLPKGDYFVEVAGGREIGEVGAYQVHVAKSTAEIKSATEPSPQSVAAGGKPASVERFGALGLSSDAIVLEWSSVADGEGYRIERSTGGENFETIGSAPQYANGYRDLSVQPGQRYFYRIVTLNSIDGDVSSRTVQALAGVADVAAIVAASNRVALSWTPDYPKARYYVQRAVDRSDEFVTVGAVDGNAQTFIDQNAIPGNNLKYRVVAVEDVSTLKHLKEDSINIIRLPDGAEEKNYFGLRINGKIRIDDTGFYTFFLNSDDGSKLFLDGTLVIDNDGRHAPLNVAGTIQLAAGYHDVEVQYFQIDGRRALELSWNGPGPAHPKISHHKLPDPYLSDLTYSYYEGDWLQMPFERIVSVSSIVNVSTPLTSDADGN